MKNIWIGDNYQRSALKILILGESWYGEDKSLAIAIREWASGEKDATFRRIFKAARGKDSKNATEEEKLEFWHSISFYNFIDSVGPTRQYRPTAKHYESAKLRLVSVLMDYKPKAVWILGKGQALHSKSIITDFGMRAVVTAHPTSFGLKNKDLADSWNELLLD